MLEQRYNIAPVPGRFRIRATGSDPLSLRRGADGFWWVWLWSRFTRRHYIYSAVGNQLNDFLGWCKHA